MLDRLARVPQMVFMVILFISMAFLVSFMVGLEYAGADTFNAPVSQLSGDYWYVLIIVLVALPAAVVSTYFLGWAKGQTPSSLLAGMGTVFLGYLLFNINGGWNGATLLAAAGAGFFFALAGVFRLLERHSRQIALTDPNNSETS
jgi:hypothetical protein